MHSISERLSLLGALLGESSYRPGLKSIESFRLFKILDYMEIAKKCWN